MRRFHILALCIACCCGVWAQGFGGVELLKQRKLGKYGVRPGQYSGITKVDDSTYLVVSDKDSTVLWHRFNVSLYPQSAKINRVDICEQPSRESLSRRDMEGVAYDSSTGMVYVSGEGDQRVLEYDTNGRATGRELLVPSCCSLGGIRSNRGFEALCFDASNHRILVATEEPVKSNSDSTVHIHVFDDRSLRPIALFSYRMSYPERRSGCRIFLHGISDMTVVDSTLIVMERTVCLKKRYVGSYTETALYGINISGGIPCGAKFKICSFRTRLNLTRRVFANYEGVCEGPRLADGRKTLLLINDSQDGAGNALYHLKDYLKVLVLH